ncbi:hypothetical protein [Pseudomonas monteilii]|uniref:hypothetical protein n=1 Tax=Pseudomonas monteilii TaxID=76759 RepID=UPI001E2E08A6|nr:hypothetical protein [Pseudomonas monteilii]MCE1007580.1 hypothetical protein [Pseudomonas monteilii]
MRLILPIALASVLLSGCSPIRTYENLSQNTEISLTTHVGGQVLKVERSSDLPNAFGKADLFGGKIDKGFTELRYQGMTPDGRPVFRLTEIETTSTETTMSRYGGRTTNFNVQSYGNQSYGTINSYAAPSGDTERLPPNTTEFAVPVKRRTFDVGNVRVTIMSFDETSIVYSLSR